MADTFTANLGLHKIDLASDTLAESAGELNWNFDRIDTVYQDLINQLQSPDAATLGGQPLSYVLDLGNASGLLPVAQIDGFEAAWSARFAAELNTLPEMLDTLAEITAQIQGNESVGVALTAQIAAVQAALADFASLNHTHTTADLPMAAPADLTADPPPQNKIPSLADVRDLSAGLPYRRGDVALLPRLDGVPQGWTSMERFSVLLVSGIFSFPINMNDAWRAIVGSKLVVPTRYTAAQSGDAGYVVDLDTGLITVMAEPADRRLNPLLVPLSDTELLIAGGWRTGTQTLLASSEIYNVATNSYTPSTNLPVTLAESVGCLLPGGDVVAAGGRRSHSSTLNHHFFRRDAASGAWTQMTQTPEPFQHSNYRGAGILQLPSGKVLLTGGGSMEASLFDPVANTCVRVADCPFMAFGTKKLRVNGADWHLFGGAAYDEPTDSWFRSFISTPMMSSPLDDAGRFYGDASLNVNMAINSQYVVKD